MAVFESSLSVPADLVIILGVISGFVLLLDNRKTHADLLVRHQQEAIKSAAQVLLKAGGTDHLAAIGNDVFPRKPAFLRRPQDLKLKPWRRVHWSIATIMYSESKLDEVDMDIDVKIFYQYHRSLAAAMQGALSSTYQPTDSQHAEGAAPWQKADASEEVSLKYQGFAPNQHDIRVMVFARKNRWLGL